MATYVYDTFTSLSLPALAGSTVLVTQNGTLFSEAFDTVDGTGNLIVSVFGNLISAGGDALDRTGAGFVDINIGLTGTIASHADSAIEVDADRLDVRNAGTIQGSLNAIAYANRAGSTVMPLSRIRGRSSGKSPGRFQAGRMVSI